MSKPSTTTMSMLDQATVDTDLVPDMSDDCAAALVREILESIYFKKYRTQK